MFIRKPLWVIVIISLTASTAFGGWLAFQQSRRQGLEARLWHLLGSIGHLNAEAAVEGVDAVVDSCSGQDRLILQHLRSASAAASSGNTAEARIQIERATGVLAKASFGPTHGLLVLSSLSLLAIAVLGFFPLHDRRRLGQLPGYPLLQRVFEVTDLGMIVLRGSDLTIAVANPAFARLIGRSVDELREMEISKLRDANLSDSQSQHLEATLSSTSHAMAIECIRLRSADGAEIVTSWHVHPVADGVVCTIRDCSRELGRQNEARMEEAAREAIAVASAIHAETISPLSVMMETWQALEYRDAQLAM